MGSVPRLQLPVQWAGNICSSGLAVTGNHDFFSTEVVQNEEQALARTRARSLLACTTGVESKALPRSSTAQELYSAIQQPSVLFPQSNGNFGRRYPVHSSIRRGDLPRTIPFSWVRDGRFGFAARLEHRLHLRI